MPTSACSSLLLKPARAGKTAVIPPRQTRKTARAFDKHLYKARHLIENFFAKVKQFRAIATRYDKTARCFLAGIHLAATAIWLNRGHALTLQLRSTFDVSVLCGGLMSAAPE